MLLLSINSCPISLQHPDDIMPYSGNVQSVPILFIKIYSNLVSYICNLPSTNCIFSQIYLLRCAPNFYEIHPWSVNDKCLNLLGIDSVAQDSLKTNLHPFACSLIHPTIFTIARLK
jgi:hypothetical protein